MALPTQGSPGWTQQCHIPTCIERTRTVHVCCRPVHARGTPTQPACLPAACRHPTPPTHPPTLAARHPARPQLPSGAPAAPSAAAASPSSSGDLPVPVVYEVASTSGSDADEFVILEKRDAIEAFAYYLADILVDMPEAQALGPKQLQAALVETLRVRCRVPCLPACLPACRGCSQPARGFLLCVGDGVEAWSRGAGAGGGAPNRATCSLARSPRPLEGAPRVRACVRAPVRL